MLERTSSVEGIGKRRRITMSFKRARRDGLLIALSGLTLYSVSLAACEPFPGKLIESREFANNKFRVRVEIYGEGNKAHLFESGCHVRVSSAPVGSIEWHDFASAYFSHCDEIPKDQVRLVNDKTAYVFMQWWYSVTMDAGITWSSWDVASHLPEKTYYNPRLIQDVSIDSDGTGTMLLNPEGVREKKPLILHTQDFGQQWKLE